MINFQGRVKNHLLQRQLLEFLHAGSSDGKQSACNVGDLGLIPGTGKIPQRRKWLPTPVFLPGESMDREAWQTTSPWGHKESDKTEQLILSLFFYLRAKDQNAMGDGGREGRSWLDEIFILSGARKTQQLKTVIRKPLDNCEICISLGRHSWE